LPDAKTGFSLSSTLFELQEGIRDLTITVDYQRPPAAGPDDPQPIIQLPSETFSFESLNENIRVYCTGEKGWLGPYELSSESILLQNQMILKFQIALDEPAVVAYDKEIHLEDYNTDRPVIRFLIDQSTEAGYDINRRLALNTLTKIKVDIDVEEVTSLVLENDTGVINAKKPFYPFTTDPIKRSNFTIDYPEVFKKPWTNIVVNILWKDTPEVSFNDHYGNYNPNPVTNDSYFKVKSYILDRGSYSDIDSSDNTTTPDKRNLSLFKKNGDVYDANYTFSNSGYVINKNGPLQLSLNTSFLQEVYPTQYALAISKEILTPPTDPPVAPAIPKEPYIPLIDVITMKYSASTETTLRLIEATRPGEVIDEETQKNV